MSALAVDEPRTPVRVAEQERPAVRELEVALDAAVARNVYARLYDPTSRQTLEFPKSVFDVLVRVVHAMSRGDAVSVIPVHAMLTTQEAADLLNVSRPHVIELLNRKQIPYDKPDRPGGHRRVRLDDVLAYKTRRSAARRKLLADLTREAEDDDRYD